MARLTLALLWLLHVWRGIDHQTIIDNAIDEHVCGQKPDISSNYCDKIQPYDMTRDVSVSVKCDTIFRLFFFGNHHKFALLTFAR